MRLTISLRRDEFGELLGLAQAERRRPADQAALLVAEALKERSTPESRALIPAPDVWDARCDRQAPWAPTPAEAGAT